MRSLMKVGLGLLLLALVLIGLCYAVLRSAGISNPTSPAGRAVRADTRALNAAITRIDLDGPIDLTVRKGASASMKVRGEQRLLANIDTVQDGNTLHIGTKGMVFHHRSPLRVELVLPSLTSLEVHGTGDSAVKGFSGERFTLRLYGSGNVAFSGRFRQVEASLHGSGELDLEIADSDSVALELTGSGDISARGAARSLTANLGGSGDLDAERLITDSARLELTGSGDASLFARQSAELGLHGSGDVHVHGNPARRKAASTGSGEVKWQ